MKGGKEREIDGCKQSGKGKGRGKRKRKHKPWGGGEKTRREGSE